MGAYSTKPETETVTEEGTNGKLSFGASAMKGWRLTQEDAHVALLDYDETLVKSHLFAVFDGHGGAEVAQFAAQTLPEWIKKLPAFRQGDVAAALTEAFLSFDQHLTEASVIAQLKALAGDDQSDEDENEQLNEAIMLKEEADMPIEQLMAKYSQKAVPDESKNKSNTGPSGSAEPVAGGSGISSLSSSPGKAAKSNDHKIPSKSAEAAGSSQSLAEGHSSNGDTESSANGESARSANGVNTKPVTATGSPAKEADASVKQNGDEGKVSVEQIEKDDAPKIVGKGKQRKVIIPKPKRKPVEPAATYQQFLEDYDDSDDDSSDEEETFGAAPHSDDDDDDGDDEAEAADTSDDDDEDDDEEESESSDEDDGQLRNMFFSPTGDFEEPGKDSGCTAVVALIWDKTLYVANAGDSRCVVSCNGKAIEMSEDHKPEDEKELQRIEKAGGKVTLDGRVNGGLNLSRALGDHTYKCNPDLSLREQMISSEPDVRELTLTPEHDFMILACDGIWNSMTSQEVVNFVRGRLDRMKPAKICEELFEHCLAPDTSGDGTGCDNMTAIIVTFDDIRQTQKRKLEPADEVQAKREKEEVAQSDP